VEISGSPFQPGPERSVYLAGDYLFFCYSEFDTTHDTVHIYRLDITSGVDDPQAIPPSLECYPNPFCDALTISMQDANSRAHIDVFNLRGQKVRELQMKNGESVWDGKDVSGKETGAGIYLLKVKNSNESPIRVLRYK
jgi:hypothetical protein